MADKVSKVAYAYVMAADRPGEGAKVLGALRKAGVNLIAYAGFPTAGRKAQLVLVPEKMARLKSVAQMKGLKLSPTKTAFLVKGKDRVGAVARSMEKLARARVNITAAHAVSGGGGSYGMVIWVKEKAIAKAAKALGA